MKKKLLILIGALLLFTLTFAKAEEGGGYGFTSNPTEISKIELD